MSAALDRKTALLRRILQKYTPGLIAVSGGVDSRLLLWVSQEWDLQFEAVYLVGPHQSESDQTLAGKWLRTLSVPVHTLPLKPMQWLNSNPRNRCYLCKRQMYAIAWELARERGLGSVLDGTQADDLKAYRPGLKAVQELQVRSPLAEAGLTKQDVRTLARTFGLARPEQPARPCLLTRFPYGRAISPRELERISQGERILQQAGFLEIRLRKTTSGDYVLQMEKSGKSRWELAGAGVLQTLAQESIEVRKVLFSNSISGYFDQEDEHGQSRVLLGPESDEESTV